MNNALYTLLISVFFFLTGCANTLPVDESCYTPEGCSQGDTAAPVDPGNEDTGVPADTDEDTGTDVESSGDTAPADPEDTGSEDTGSPKDTGTEDPDTGDTGTEDPVDDTGSPEDTGSDVGSEDTGSTEDPEDTGSPEDTGDTGIEDTGSTEDTGTEDPDTGDTGTEDPVDDTGDSCVPSPELMNWADDDCDDVLDNGCDTSCDWDYVSTDSDGTQCRDDLYSYWATGDLTFECTGSAWRTEPTTATEDDLDGDGYTEAEGDCADWIDSIYPGARDWGGDGVDQDCDGDDLDSTWETDDDGDGYTEYGGDTDDTDPNIYPGAPEYGDWIDNDGDGLIDEDCDWSCGGANDWDHDGVVDCDDDWTWWYAYGGDVSAKTECVP